MQCDIARRCSRRQLSQSHCRAEAAATCRPAAVAAVDRAAGRRGGPGLHGLALDPTDPAARLTAGLEPRLFAQPETYASPGAQRPASSCKPPVYWLPARCSPPAARQRRRRQPLRPPSRTERPPRCRGLAPMPRTRRSSQNERGEIIGLTIDVVNAAHVPGPEQSHQCNGRQHDEPGPGSSRCEHALGRYPLRVSRDEQEVCRAIFRRTGLRRLRAEKTKARQTNGLCDQSTSPRPDGTVVKT